MVNYIVMVTHNGELHFPYPQSGDVLGVLLIPHNGELQFLYVTKMVLVKLRFIKLVTYIVVIPIMANHIVPVLKFEVYEMSQYSSPFCSSPLFYIPATIRSPPK